VVDKPLIRYLFEAEVPDVPEMLSIKSPLPVALIPENVTLEALEPSVTESISVYVGVGMITPLFRRVRSVSRHPLNSRAIVLFLG
jgi:hypothetical protein